MRLITDSQIVHAAGLCFIKNLLRIIFVVTGAKQSTEEIQGSIMFSLSAKIVRVFLRPINTLKRSIVQGHAQENHGLVLKKGERTLKVLRKESAGKHDVYCIRVPKTSAFALSCGAIVHNCRYALMMRRYAKYYGELSKPKEIKMPAPLRPVSRTR